MGISEILERVAERKREKKELIRQMDNQLKAEKMLSDRRKSANERELEKFMDEDREESIKIQLEKARKMRQDEINFGSNPLDVPNITNHVSWNVLKERNLFSNGKMTINKGDGNVMRSNKNLMRNNNKFFRI